MPTLYGYPVWIAFLAGLAPLILATEFGFRAGRRLGEAARQRAKFETGSLQASILGLLALLLGFTYSTSMSNYQERRLLVVKDANAIATALLRAQLLPKPLAQQASQALRRVLDLRLEWAADDATQAQSAAKRGAEAQKDLWAIAVRFAEQDRSAVAAQFIVAANAVIDSGAEREAAAANRLPIQMFGLLGLLALVAMAITGYGCGIAGDRAFVATTIVSVLVTAVTIVICDIHEPRQGFITKSQQSLIDLRASLD
ncbi:hypothetical protein [Methylocapsa acidiphila]|uniref:bestrophin-like domain n=1 Tax=Methylocapsa acidiphila TaxID=133552 RepID=UPI000410D345|nr:hypothetical protein [Methylocapsa acidiphila]